MSAISQVLTLQSESLADQITSSGSIEPLFSYLDIAITDWEKEQIRPEDLLPTNREPGLGFAFRDRRNGQNLWQAIATAARESVCSESGDLHKFMTSSGTAGTGYLVGEVMRTLGLSPQAAPMAVAVAALIMAVGIRGFCEWSSGELNEPGAP